MWCDLIGCMCRIFALSTQQLKAIPKKKKTKRLKLLYKNHETSEVFVLHKYLMRTHVLSHKTKILNW